MFVDIKNIITVMINRALSKAHSTFTQNVLKVHKIEIFFGFDFEICIISLLVMWKY